MWTRPVWTGYREWAGSGETARGMLLSGACPEGVGTNERFEKSTGSIHVDGQGAEGGRGEGLERRGENAAGRGVLQSGAG